MRRWQVLQTAALVLVFGHHEGALDAHELAGHRGPTYEVTDPLQLEPGQRRLKLTILDRQTAKPTAARFSLTLDGEIREAGTPAASFGTVRIGDRKA